MSVALQAPRQPAALPARDGTGLTSELLRAFCHDCRTPLAVISEFASIVREDLDPEEAQEGIELLALVNDRVFDIDALLGDLECLRGALAGEAGEASAPMPIARLLEEIRLLMEGVAARWGQCLEVEIEPVAAVASCGPFPCRNVILALLNDLGRSAARRETMRIRVLAGSEAGEFALCMWRSEGWAVAEMLGGGDDGRVEPRTFRQQFAATILARSGGGLMVRMRETNPVFVVRLPRP